MKSLSKVRIYHNSKCGTSRNALGLIRNTGIEPEIIDYQKYPLTSHQLQHFVTELKISPQDLIRKKDLKEPNLSKILTDNEIFSILEKDSSLLQRPIVVTEHKGMICRPSHTVLEILPSPQLAPYVLENGDVVKTDGSFCSKQLIGNYHKITVHQIDTIQVITINRSECRNAVDEETAIELLNAFEEINSNTSLTACVLTGSNGTFCAGYDLKSLFQNPQLHQNSNTRTSSFSTFSSFIRSGYMGPSRLPMRVPVIAAVEGYAVAGGLELSLWCDIRIASSTAIFGVHCRRWGVPLIDGGTVRLPRLIGQSRAMDMILTGRDVDAKEAYSIGLANRLVEKGQALRSAIDYAIQISRFPSSCMNKDREMVYKQWDLTTEEALREEGIRNDLTNEIMDQAIKGAERFVKGKGRGGDSKNI